MPPGVHDSGSTERRLDSSKRFAFDSDESAIPASSGLPFEHFLKDTKAAKLSSGLKATLWIAAILVGLLFFASVRRLMNPRPKPPASETEQARRDDRASSRLRALLDKRTSASRGMS